MLKSKRSISLFLESTENLKILNILYFRTTLNYIEHFLILAFTITECILISPFASLLGTPMGIMISTIGLKLCAIKVEI